MAQTVSATATAKPTGTDRRRARMIFPPAQIAASGRASQTQLNYSLSMRWSLLRHELRILTQAVRTIGVVVTRHDVSAVPPQGGYVAKQCPVRAQWDVIEPCEPLRPSAALESMFARGIGFEARVLARLLDLHQDACAVAGRDQSERAEREAATVAAMTAAA